MKIRKKTEEPRDTVLTIRLSKSEQQELVEDLVQIITVLSKSEQQELKRLAAKAGLSVGAFLLGLALGDAAGKKLLDSLQNSRKEE